MRKLVVLSLLAASLQALGQSTFTVSLNQAQEVGPTGSPAIGSGTLVLNPDNTVTYNISYSGLTGDWTASHIHGNATSFPGFNAGVIVGLNNVPDGTRAGSLQGTTAALSATQVGFITSGSAYVNIHSATFGGGEIRGQIIAVPEPSILALGGLGLGGLWFGARRRS